MNHIKILINSVRCHLCNDIITSRHRHDFLWCKCGNIAVDGGKEYLRRVGLGVTNKTYDDLSITEKIRDVSSDQKEE